MCVHTYFPKELALQPYQRAAVLNPHQEGLTQFVEHQTLKSQVGNKVIDDLV